MKILLVNLHALSNRGDAAITHVALAHLRYAFPGAQITLAANHPAEFAALDAHVVPSFKTWVWSAARANRSPWHPLRLVLLVLAAISLVYWRRSGHLPRGWRGDQRALLRAYTEADLIVGIGGNMLYARHRWALMFWIVCFTFWCARLCRTPLVLLPQTIGPFHHRVHVWGARQALRHARLVLLRDHESWRLATGVLHLDLQRCVTTADLALFLADDTNQHTQPPARGPIIGVSVLDWGAQMPLFDRQKAYEDAIAGAVTQLVAHGYRVAFFAQSDTPVWGENDAVPAQRIIDRLNPTVRVAVDGPLTVPYAPRQILRFFAQFRLVIATRLHAAILSAAAGTPVVHIAYTSKSWGFVAGTALEPLTFGIAMVDADALAAAALAVLADEQNWRDQVAALVAAKRRQADIVARLREATKDRGTGK